MGGWFLSRRDSTIVARHEVPGLEFGHLWRVTSGSFCPKGAGGLSPGFQPWETDHQGRGLKGRQIECTNDAKVGSKLYTSQLRTLVFAL
jgi:hypothetical protein